MVTITFVQPDGQELAVEVTPGISLMEAAVKNGVTGIDADCGGSCACATCQVYVDESWRTTTGEPQELEQSMLDFAVNPRPDSRLSCQIMVTAELDGLVVRIPQSQR
jgi:2Fe-2S ferredoxin